MPTNNTTKAPECNRTAPFDWEQDWIRLQGQRRHTDQVNYWNMRSKSFDRAGKPSAYVQSFIERLALEEGDEVLDMGCGTGSIAVPLALAGHRVVAADFSEGMVEEMAQRIEEAGTENVTSLVMAWEDDWGERGIGPNCVDVAFASRSLSVADLGAALRKLSYVARKSCCVTCACGYSPRMDARVLAACGLENLHGSDHQYVFNILVQQGYRPSVSYILSTRKDSYDSVDDAEADFGRMVDDLAHLYPAEQIAEARTRLRTWLEGELVDNPDEGKIDERGWLEKRLCLREERIVPWAFISWGV